MNLETFIRLIILCPLLLLNSTACANRAQGLELILDMANRVALPHRFWTAEQALPAGAMVSVTGLSDLAIAGTSQFSEMALQEITRHFKAPFIIVDLRQESHGFIDGNAVTWMNQWNNANRGETAAQILQDEKERLFGLQTLPTIPVIANAKDETRHRIFLSNKDIQSEQQLAKKMGLGYQRFFITDHFAPNATEVDRFIRFYQGLPKETRLLFHCRGGAGRTTTFLIMVDMMQNAKRVSFEDIVKRQMLLGGKDLLKLPGANEYKYGPAKLRQDFLKLYYQYCRSNNDHYRTSWSEWLNRYQKVK